MKTTAALLLLTLSLKALPAQTPAKNAAAVERAAAGDSPADPGPLAKGLSTALNSKDIRRAMKKVVDWQLAYVGLTGDKTPIFNQQWTYAPLYDGLLAYSRDTSDPAAHDAVLRMAEKFQWQLLDTRFPHADDEALGHAYLDLYTEKPDPVRLASTKAIIDRLISRPDESKPVWWWCDALYMAPPTLVRMAKITGDHKYIDYMNHEWWDVTTKLLYDPKEHLFYRDERFLNISKQHEANGRPVFWSRGDGWVLAGLVNILTYLPKDDLARPKYEAMFKDMASKVASLQPADGLWRTGLLDPDTYQMPEVSGSAFYAYAMAWGMNHGLLDRETFEPAVSKTWAAMVGHIYADGRLGNIQPIGFAPDKFEPSASYVYGVGAFLLAGTELEKLYR